MSVRFAIFEHPRERQLGLSRAPGFLPMSTAIDSFEQRQLRKVPRFQAGDRVKVHFQVVEAGRSRVQVFEGVVIKRQGRGIRETFTVRKHSFGVGVERTFPLHSPKIERLEVAARGDVSRAKLYYLRERVGKRARVAERRWGVQEEVLGVGEGEAVDAAGEVVEEVEPEASPEEVGGDETEAGEAAEVEAEPEAEAEVEADPEADVEAEPQPESEPEADAGEQVADAADAAEAGENPADAERS